MVSGEPTLKVAVFGRLPPPIGGVTMFIKNLLQAAVTVPNVAIDLVGDFGVRLSEYDAAIINASNPLKRLIQVLIGKIFARHVYFTVHGGNFDSKNIFNALSLKLVCGVFCLNGSVKSHLSAVGIRSFLHTTVFLENADKLPTRKGGCRSRRRVLFYINNDRSIDGREIYGARFIAGILRHLIEDLSLVVVVVDISACYRDWFGGVIGVEYMDHAVDFKDLLADIDVYIRPTSTDGMSLALLEAVIMGVPCLASDVVDRPGPVVTYAYGSEEDFLEKLKIVLDGSRQDNTPVSLTSIKEYLAFMMDGNR